jgi:glycine cleavage system aminomethyltransferase T
MDGPAPTEGAPISIDGEVHGHVTTSFTSPLLGKAVMLGWLKRGVFPETVTIDGRPAHRAETPFYDPSGARARA